jgi:hypothetical protein
MAAKLYTVAFNAAPANGTTSRYEVDVVGFDGEHAESEADRIAKNAGLSEIKVIRVTRSREPQIRAVV